MLCYLLNFTGKPPKNCSKNLKSDASEGSALMSVVSLANDFLGIFLTVGNVSHIILDEIGPLCKL